MQYQHELWWNKFPLECFRLFIQFLGWAVPVSRAAAAVERLSALAG
jgi:hypothetical protein